MVRSYVKLDSRLKAMEEIFYGKYFSLNDSETINKFFLSEKYAKPLGKNYLKNKADVYQNGDTWSLDILDLIDCGSKRNKGDRDVLVGIDTFGAVGWIVHLKNKNSQIIKHSSERSFINSKRKPDLIET